MRNAMLQGRRDTTTRAMLLRVGEFYIFALLEDRYE
jgi:hypothetical protein